MMFNGLMVYGDSDTSDVTKESVGSSSALGRPGSARSSHCLENKLMATLEVLKNKEETVRVQAESLALAEARIAALSARAHTASATRADRTQTIHSTRSSADECCVETSDVTVQTQDAGDDAVSALQDNLSIIEDLYRECFYETAKQEELIDLLRKSCLDVRSMERQKEAHIGRLQGVVASQKWSLERCQGIAAEVESLKLEISNFLNSSNHDSGMWERTDESLAADVADELRHISGQLLRLRDLLRDGCSCGLEDENMRLKKTNETLEMELSEVRHRLFELEAALQDKENVSQHHKSQIQLKDQQLISLQQRVKTLEADTEEHRTNCSGLHLQVQQMQVLLQDRSEELTRAQQHCEDQAATIGQLRLELSRAESGSKENEMVRSEVTQLSAAVGQWREQLTDSRRRLRVLDEELLRERQNCRHIEHHYQEKTAQAVELQSQLEEARARGAALCEEAHRALCGVRRWMRRARHRHWEQEQTIKEQDTLIRALQQRQQSDFEQSSSDACCSRDVRARGAGSVAASDAASCSKCPSTRRVAHTSMSEMSSLSAPTPPRRSRKKPLCDDRECQWPIHREASAQRPTRADAHTRVSLRDVRAAAGVERLPGEISPTDELLERVDRTQAALAEARRRWRLETSGGARGSCA